MSDRLELGEARGAGGEEEEVEEVEEREFRSLSRSRSLEDFFLRLPVILPKIEVMIEPELEVLVEP